MENFNDEKKKLIKYMFLIVFGVLFYTIIGKTENYQWIIKAISPLLLAFSIAYILEPLVKLLCRKFKMKRTFSVLIVLLGLIGLVGLTVGILIPSLVNSISDLLVKIDIDNIIKAAEDLFKTTENSTIAPYMQQIWEVVSKGLSEFTKIATGMLQNVLSLAGNLASTILNFIVTLCIAIYMLLDKEDLMARIKRVFYAFGKKESVDDLMVISSRANEIFKRFFVGKIIDSAIIGVICFVLMTIFRIPYALLLSIIIGITNMIPYFGPFIGGVPAFILVLFVNFKSAIIAGIIIIALQQFDGLYLGPKILGDKVGVGAFWIIVSVTVGGAIMGVWGMLLGVPIVVLIKTLVEETVQRRLDEKGLGDIEAEKLR